MSLVVLETEAGFRCSLSDCAVSSRAYAKLAGLASHQAFRHGIRSPDPYRHTSTRRGLDRKTDTMDADRRGVLAAIPKMHAPPLERIIPDARPREPLPVDPGSLAHIRKRIEWTVLQLAKELRQPDDNVRAAFALIVAPKTKSPAPSRLQAKPQVAVTTVVTEVREYVISVCPDCRQRRKPARGRLLLEPLPFNPPVLLEMSA